MRQFGLDSTHPSPGPGASSRPTITAVVASMDRCAAAYQATVRVQEGRLEIISDLREMVHGASSLSLRSADVAQRCSTSSRRATTA